MPATRTWAARRRSRPGHARMDVDTPAEVGGDVETDGGMVEDGRAEVDVELGELGGDRGRRVLDGDTLGAVGTCVYARMVTQAAAGVHGRARWRGGGVVHELPTRRMEESLDARPASWSMKDSGRRRARRGGGGAPRGGRACARSRRTWT